jgi:hypothetical protein
MDESTVFVRALRAHLEEKRKQPKRPAKQNIKSQPSYRSFHGITLHLRLWPIENATRLLWVGSLARVH